MTTQVDGLAALLAGEYAAVAAYQIAGGVLARSTASAAVGAAVRAGYDAHRGSRDQLLEAIAAAGGTAPEPHAGYATPFPVHDPGAAVRLVVLVEDRLCRVAAAAVAQQDGADRLLAADVLSGAAVRAAQLRLLAGAAPAKAVTPLPGL